MKMVGRPDGVKTSAPGVLCVLEGDGWLVLLQCREVSDLGQFAFTARETENIDIAGIPEPRSGRAGLEGATAFIDGMGSVRDMPVMVLELDDVPAEVVRGASVKVAITPADEGVKQTVLTVGVFEPGQALVPHSHDKSEEIYLCLEGEGTFYHGKEMTPVPLKPGTIIFVPPNTLHSTKNTSDKKFKIAFFMSPGTDSGSYLSAMKKKGVTVADKWLQPDAAKNIR
jgi:quercetin dioxygenase-like cupin family protein